MRLHLIVPVTVSVLITLFAIKTAAVIVGKLIGNREITRPSSCCWCCSWAVIAFAVKKNPQSHHSLIGRIAITFHIIVCQWFANMCVKGGKIRHFQKTEKGLCRKQKVNDLLWFLCLIYFMFYIKQEFQQLSSLYFRCLPIFLVKTVSHLFCLPTLYVSVTLTSVFDQFNFMY